MTSWITSHRWKWCHRLFGNWWFGDYFYFVSCCWCRSSCPTDVWEGRRVQTRGRFWWRFVCQPPRLRFSGRPVICAHCRCRRVGYVCWYHFDGTESVDACNLGQNLAVFAEIGHETRQTDEVASDYSSDAGHFVETEPAGVERYPVNLLDVG